MPLWVERSKSCSVMPGNSAVSTMAVSFSTTSMDGDRNLSNPLPSVLLVWRPKNDSSAESISLRNSTKGPSDQRLGRKPDDLSFMSSSIHARSRRDWKAVSYRPAGMSLIWVKVRLVGRSRRALRPAHDGADHHAHRAWR